MEADGLTVRVHSFESMGTYDGPGLRLVVFLQGCNFRCAYCANPDTLALMGGRDVAVTEIVRRAVSERPFFGRRGGVTFSGGEPTLQAGRLLPLFRLLRDEGIHICLDTNGSVDSEEARELMRLTDIVLLDVKEVNDMRHRGLTGQSNAATLATAAWLEAEGREFWLRYVLVPGVTSFAEDIKALGEMMGGYRHLTRVEILPYHTLGRHKYDHLGMAYRLDGVSENTPGQLAEAERLFKTYFANVRVN